MFILPEVMKAAVFYQPNKIDIQEKQIPKNDSTILLKVRSCTVCGYDVRVFRNGHKKVNPPIILGHEICGETLSDLPAMKSGTRVAVYPILPCFVCRYCHNQQYNLCTNIKEIGSTINGGFAEYVGIPKEIEKIGGLVPIPDSISTEEASLIEPLACCLNGFSNLGKISPEQSVAIIGDGPIGLIHLQISKNLFGAKTVVIGKNKSRMDQAKVLGAYQTFMFGSASDEILKANGGAGFDVVIIATSDPAVVDLALKIAGKGARINLFAGNDNTTNLDYNYIHYNQISVIGSFGSLPHHFREAMKFAEARSTIDLSKLITHKFSLDEIHKAFSATENYDGLRVAVNFPS